MYRVGNGAPLFRTPPNKVAGFLQLCILCGQYILFIFEFIIIGCNTGYLNTFCLSFQRCMESDLLVRRRDLSCYGVRGCSVAVDIGALEILLWEAAQVVRIRKRRLSSFRKFSFGINSINDVMMDNEIFLYRKAYDFPLGDVTQKCSSNTSNSSAYII